MGHNRKIMIGIILIVMIGAIFMRVDHAGMTMSKEEAHEQLETDKKITLNQSKKGIVVLCYHRILKDDKLVSLGQKMSTNSQLHQFNVNISKFKQQMSYLKQHHIPVISTEEMVWRIQHKQVIKKYIVITFDDVDRTVIENALPVLKKTQLPFTSFVISGKTGDYMDGSQMANVSELKQVAKMSRATIGYHTDNMHRQINGIPILASNKNYEAFKIDFKQNKSHLKEEIPSSSTRYFASPYGVLTRKMANYLMTQGISAIFSLKPGVVTQHTDLKDIPRVIVSDDNWQSVTEWLSNN
ncbi:polysaccharide deacetylase family protein [Dellaglioa sp. BT-FLS60]